MAIILSDIIATPSIFAVGEQVNIKFTLQNTGSYAIANIFPYLFTSDQDFGSTGSYRRSQSIYGSADLGYSANISSGASKSFSFDFVVDEVFLIEFKRYPDEHGVTCGLRIDADDSRGRDGDSYEVERGGIALMLDMRYQPSVSTLTVERTPTEESTSARITLRCSLASGANTSYSGLAVTVQWREAGAAAFPSGNSSWVPASNALAGTTVTPNFTFEPSKAYDVRVTFSDAFDAATSQRELGKAFANLHLSGSGYGIAFGQYSTATEAQPKFECAYPAYFNGGIPQFDYATAATDTGLKWIDGKAIYRKVIAVTASAALNAAQYTTGVSSSSMLWIDQSASFYASSDGSSVYPPGYTTSGGTRQLAVGATASSGIWQLVVTTGAAGTVYVAVMYTG